MAKEVGELDRRSERLQALYGEQDELLDQIFNGAYGSDKENQLESFLDQTEEMRNRIVEANFKWKQAQMMIDYSYKQLEFAVNKWTGLQNVNEGLVLNYIEIARQCNHCGLDFESNLNIHICDFRALDQRYEAAVEVRNNLVAASQNIQGAQRYLSSVQFPYCAPSEVDTLNKVGGLHLVLRNISCQPPVKILGNFYFTRNILVVQFDKRDLTQLVLLFFYRVFQFVVIQDTQISSKVQA